MVLVLLFATPIAALAALVALTKLAGARGVRPVAVPAPASCTSRRNEATMAWSISGMTFAATMRSCSETFEEIAPSRR